MKYFVILILVGFLMFGSFVVINSNAVLSPLKQQVIDRNTSDNYNCWNMEQILVLRSNGKFACIYPHTAEKLNWQEFVFSKTHHDIISLFDIHPFNIYQVKTNDGGNSFVVIGFTYLTDKIIDVYIKNPKNVVISEDTVFSDKDGNIEFYLTTGGPLWNKSGYYSIDIVQNNFTQHHTIYLEKTG